MTTTTAVERTTNTTPVVEGVEAPSSVKEVEGVSKTPAPAEHKNVENEQSTFIEMTKDHVQNTEAHLTEELENAEILKSVEEFENVRDEMVPDEEWMRRTLTALTLENALEEVGEIEVEVDVEDEVEKGEVEEVAPEDIPLPVTPSKLRERPCQYCHEKFSSMAGLMGHVVRDHGVDTGDVSPIGFMTAELLGYTKDDVRLLREELEVFREEERQFRKYMTQTLMQDMMEGMRKVIKKEIEENEKTKKKQKEEEECEVDVMKADKSKPPRPQAAPRRPQQPPPPAGPPGPPVTTTSPPPASMAPAPSPTLQPAGSVSSQQGSKGSAFQAAPRPRGKVTISLVGDSVARNFVGPKLEEATGSVVTRTSAYAAQDGSRARYPDQVVSKVIRQLKKPVHTAILGACSVDITNQQTAGGLEDHNTVTTVASAHATIENAEYLIKSGLAKQVVVLEHAPRHDSKAKAELAVLANTTLHTARKQSEQAEHILVGRHSGLEVEGEEKERRFTNDGSNNQSKHKRRGINDGIHMYSQAGAVAFTASLVSILQQAGLGSMKRQPGGRSSAAPAHGAWQAAQPGRGFRANNNQRNQPMEPMFNLPTHNMFQGFY